MINIEIWFASELGLTIGNLVHINSLNSSSEDIKETIGRGELSNHGLFMSLISNVHQKFVVSVVNNSYSLWITFKREEIEIVPRRRIVEEGSCE